LAVAFPSDPLQALSQPQKLSRYMSPPQHPFQFSVKDCGATTGAHVVNAMVSPDPILLGANISITAEAVVGLSFDAAAGSVGLTLEKKTLGIWVEIPCIDNIGSCTYTDDFLCTKLEAAAARPATREILVKWGLPIACPIKTGTYNVPANNPIIAHVDDPGLSWFTDGDFYVKAELANAAKTQTGCIEAYFSITTK